jgi:hypothetical protein
LNKVIYFSIKLQGTITLLNFFAALNSTTLPDDEQDDADSDKEGENNINVTSKG